MARQSTLIALMTSATLVGAARVSAQFHETDPAAMDAFRKVVEKYRALPGVRVKSSVSMKLEQDGARGRGQEKAAEILMAGWRRGVVKINGYTCYLVDGDLIATHEQTHHSYFRTTDDGAPYYALLTAFMDLPFPHLGIAFGERAADEVCMQLHSRTPWIVPTSVEQLPTGGRAVQQIVLSSDFSTMRLDIGSDGLLAAAQVTITGGDLVQAGATLTYDYQFEHEVLSEAPVSALRFDPGDRQSVDMLAALAPPPAPAEPAPGGDDGGAGGGAVVGQPAPPLLLATADGDAVDLEDHRGKVVVLDFWATWCGPCRRALPLLHEVAEWGRREKLPVVFVAVNSWETGDGPDARLAAVREFWTSNKFTIPVAMDYADEVAAAYGVRGIPATFVIRPDGVVHATHSGAGPDYVRELQREIEEALAAAPPES